MKKRFLRLATGLIIGLMVLALGVWILIKELAMRETFYHGRPGAYWAAQLSAPDAAASNEANTILNVEIIPNLTGVMFYDTNDSALRVGLVDALNGLPGVTIPFMRAEQRRKSAVFELGEYGPAARTAVPALLRALNGDDDAVREGAASSLGNIRSEPETVIPALTRCLYDDSVNESAAYALGEFGPAAEAAVPQLVVMLHTGDGETQFAALQALKKIDAGAYARARLMRQGVTNNTGADKSGTGAAAGEK
jgi:hypothetical protein